MNNKTACCRFYSAALFSVVVLVAGTLLFPDTYANVGYHIGPIRISVLRILLIATFPSIIIFTIYHRGMVKVRAFDFFLVSTMIYINLRVVLATHQANPWPPTLAAHVLVLYYGMATVGQCKNALSTVFKTIIALVIVIAGYAMVEFFFQRNFLFADLIQEIVPDERKGYHRSGSTIGHPVMLGLFLVQALPFVIYKFAFALTKNGRYFWGMVIAFIFLALDVTLTKGAWITAGILSVVIIGWLWRRQSARMPMFVLIVSVSIVLASFNFIFQDSLKAGVFTESRKNESFVSRINVWKKVPDAVSANPVFGVGMYQGLTEIIRVWPDDERWEKPPKSIDNEFFTLIVEEGIAGTLLAGAVIISLGIQAWSLLRGGGKYSILAIPVTVSLSAVIIDGMTFNSMTNWANLVVFWVLAGAIRAMIELKFNETIA